MNRDKNLTGGSDNRQGTGLGSAHVVGERLTCLVVDDDDYVRRALERLVEVGRYRAVGACNGREALEVLEAGEVPIMISDIQMPEMDGVTLLEQVTLRWPDVAVIMATGVTEVDVGVDCLRMGAMDYMTKPFQLEDVLARVDKAIEKRDLIIQNRRYQLQLEGMVQEQAARIEELFLESVQSLADALDAKDHYTQGHAARVCAYAGQTARQLGLSEVDVQLVELGAGLHDIGKIGVNEGILQKPGRLTSDEYMHLMQHTVTGARILTSILKNAPEALAIVRSHHERLDGTGLPDGLGGDQLSIHVRIVTVSDSFDAMTTARPYRDALPTERAFSELHRCAGTQFDKDVVAAFERAFPRTTEFPIMTPERVVLRLPQSVAGIGRVA